MRVGVVGAMEEEVTILRGALQQPREEADYIQGKIHGVEVAIVKSGIGKTAAAAATALLLRQFKPDFVLNTGSAGGLRQNLKVGDIVISTEVRYHDVDCTPFGYEYGQMAEQEAKFVSDAKLVALAKSAFQAAHMEGVTIHEGLICTGDQFVCTKEQQDRIKSRFADVLALEMEAAAIAQICHQFATPVVVVRSVSDVADQEATLSFEQFLPLASKRSSQLIMQMLAAVSQTPIVF